MVHHRCPSITHSDKSQIPVQRLPILTRQNVHCNRATTPRYWEDRDRFQNAAEVKQYSGIAPVTERSGKKSWVHWRWQCPTFVRQTFVEWAAKTIHRSFWAGVYYQQQRQKGATHQMAVRALAFKWIRILYRCWKSRTPYNETVYLQALQRRGSNLVPQQIT